MADFDLYHSISALDIAVQCAEDPPAFAVLLSEIGNIDNCDLSSDNFYAEVADHLSEEAAAWLVLFAQAVKKAQLEGQSS